MIDRMYRYFADDFAKYIEANYGLIHAGPTCGKSTLTRKLREHNVSIEVVDTDDIIKAHPCLDWATFPKLKVAAEPHRDIAEYYILGKAAAAARQRGAIVLSNVYHPSFVKGFLGLPAHRKLRPHECAIFDVSIMRHKTSDMVNLTKTRTHVWRHNDGVAILRNWHSHFAQSGQLQTTLARGEYLESFLFRYWSTQFM
jgi:hypothetical protein